MTAKRLPIESLLAAEQVVFELLAALRDPEGEGLDAVLPAGALQQRGACLADIRAALIDELGLHPPDLATLGVVHTARILPPRKGQPRLVAFALVPGTSPKVIWEPTPARTVALFVEMGTWKVWGQADSVSWADAELVHLPSDLEPREDEFLSVLGSQWIMAIEPHLASLLRQETAAGETGLVAPRELANSIAVLSMLVFAIESMGARLASLGRLDGGVPGSILARIPDPDWRQQLTELIVVRNLLTHNHIWRVGVLLDGNWEFVRETEAANLHGDTSRSMYVTAAAPGGRRTRQLHLHLIPTMVRFRDVVAALPVCVRTLDFLASLDFENMRSLADHSIRIAPKTIASLRQLSASLHQDSIADGE